MLPLNISCFDKLWAAEVQRLQEEERRRLCTLLPRALFCCGIPRPTGNLPGALSQQILAGIDPDLIYLYWSSHWAL